jgi:hypothetical protein
MAKEDTKELLKFLKPFPEEVKEIALWLRDWVWGLYPTANEIIYDNYNALAFGWTISDRLGTGFCNIAIGRSSYNVHLGFLFGARLSDPDKILRGEGNQYRYLLIKKKTDLPKAYVKKLIKESYANARAKVKAKDNVPQGLTITKSISSAKRPTKKAK